MAYIDWWNRTGPITMGERFGLNEISIARETLSPKNLIQKGEGLLLEMEVLPTLVKGNIRVSIIYD